MLTRVLRTNCSTISLILLALFAQPSAFSAKAPGKLFVTMGSDLSQSVYTNKSDKILDGNDKLTVLEIDADDIENISHIAHEKFNRCGGFMVHETYEDAMNELHADAMREFAKKVSIADYSINQESLVTKTIVKAEEKTIRGVIEKLSSYRNRYYKSPTGVQSQDWLFNHWKSITKGRNDIEVKRFKHKDWPQDTIIAEFKGASSEKIVIGGHADSVAGWWGRDRAKAPGADDNASGIATTTEVLRILVNTGYRPKNTLVFAAYAAEEVGLLGSKDMAQTYKKNNETVLGVLQLDMTNYQGSEWDIVLISDFTNEGQNKFLGSVIDKYLPELKWGYDRCGYACSDHASWTSQGYPASMPFEAVKGDMNPHIHTGRDTLSQSKNNANHALKFAKMALAFVIELDN